MELSPHPALESFLHMANRLEVRDAWHCLLLRKEFENTGPHSLCNYEEIQGLLRETRLSQSGSTSAGEYMTIRLDCGVNFRPSHIILDVIDGESHVVNIIYYTKATGHISIQTNLVDIKAKLERHLKPIILNRIGEQYGI